MSKRELRRAAVKATTPEPKVRTSDLCREVRRRVYPEYETLAMQVAVIAERAGVSPRTVYRVLDQSRPTTSLDVADRILVAIGADLSCVELIGGDNAQR